jgi:hypothetical protein
MKAFDRYAASFDVIGAYEHLSLDPDYVERVLNPKPASDRAKQQAGYSAKALEDDREICDGR